MVGVFFAQGYEEIEALTVVDLLRRANIEVKMISVTGEWLVSGSHGIRVEMDMLLETVDFEQVEMIVLPGGMPGTLGLASCSLLMEQVNRFVSQKKAVGAICAAPTILGRLGLLEGRKACCYPGMEEELIGAVVVQDSVVKEGTLLTSRGMGTAIAFGLAIIALLQGEEAAERMAETIVYSA